MHVHFPDIIRIGVELPFAVLCGSCQSFVDVAVGLGYGSDSFGIVMVDQGTAPLDRVGAVENCSPALDGCIDVFARYGFGLFFHYAAVADYNAAGARNRH